MNSSFVYYKYSFEKDFKTLSFDGPYLLISEFKDKITGQQKLHSTKQGKKIPLFEIEVYLKDKPNEKLEETNLIPKNSNLILSRIPIHQVQVIPKESYSKCSESKLIKCDSCQKSMKQNMETLCCNQKFCERCLNDQKLSCPVCYKLVSKTNNDENVPLTKKLKVEETKVEPLSSDSFWMLLSTQM